MTAATMGEKSRWAVAAGVATAGTVALLWLFGLPRPPARPAAPAAAVANTREAAPARPLVKIARPSTGDALLREETELRDLSPLFLPTRFNAALPEPRREAGKTFLDNETLKLGFNETELAVVRDLPPLELVNGKPAEQAKAVDALAEDIGGVALTGFGRRRAAVAPIKPRGGFVEVVAAASGREVFSRELPVEALPPGDKSWEPIEFLATVDAAGLAVPLVVLTSSRSEEIDVHYRNYLARQLRIGDRLPPGFYRIVVGP